MLSKPAHGRSFVTLADFKTSVSHLADIPFDWQRACKNGLKYNIPVSLYVEEEGSNRIIVTYYYRTHIITVDEDYDTSLKTIEDTDFMDFSK